MQREIVIEVVEAQIQFGDGNQSDQDFIPWWGDWSWRHERSEQLKAIRRAERRLRGRP